MAATETATQAAGALDDLYRNHAAEVYRYAYAVLGNHADAEDVTQRHSSTRCARSSVASGRESRGTGSS